MLLLLDSLLQERFKMKCEHAAGLALLVLSSCVLQGFSLPQNRYSADEYARKFGSAPADENLTNDIDDAKPLAKEEGSLLSTVVEIAMKLAPLLIDTLSGSTGPSQTDRIEGIDLNGEDPFSVRNLLTLGLKLVLAVVGGNAGGIDKSDNSPVQVVIQSIMEAVIGAATGSKDRQEVTVMAEQATEVINLGLTLMETLSSSMSSRAFHD